MRVQAGLMPTNMKPMPTVGAGAHEIRIRTGREHRVFFIAKFTEAVYVLHAFEKKTRKTARADLNQGRERYLDLLAHRRKQGR
jgi:phage-related protein